MHIECKLKREGGSHVQLGAILYHFAPLPDGAHVAEVLDEAHQDRFLSITEAYRLYRGSEQGAPAPHAAPQVSARAHGEPAAAVDANPLLLGSSAHQASYEIHGTTYPLGEVVTLAAAGFKAEEWNLLSEDARADLIDEQLDKLQAAGPQAPAAQVAAQEPAPAAKPAAKKPAPKKK